MSGIEHKFDGSMGECSGCGRYVEELVDQRFCEPIDFAFEARWLLTWLSETGFPASHARSYDRARCFLSLVAAGRTG